MKLPLAGQTRIFCGRNKTQLQPANPLPNPPTTAQLLLVGHAFALSLSDMKEAQACIGHRAAGYLCDYMDKTMCVYPGTTCIQNYVLLDDLFTGN